MLWDVVRDFFVHYVFGGIDSAEEYFGTNLGWFTTIDYSEDLYDADTWIFTIGDYKYSLSNWLSTMATIISMIIIVVLACLFIKKIYNICAHVIG